MAAAPAMNLAWTPNKKHSDVERWVCIYPAYINSKKTRQEGRRLAKGKCVENPTYLEIRDVLCAANMTACVENKQYSREKSRELQFRGRIRVQMRNDDGTPCHSEFASRDAILMYVASKIPQLKTRQNKTADSQHVASSQQQHSGGGGGGNKKGKGKRR